MPPEPVEVDASWPASTEALVDVHAARRPASERTETWKETVRKAKLLFQEGIARPDLLEHNFLRFPGFRAS
jgi:hypothetical protein